MTGRSAHDALLRVLVDARLRREIPAAALGAEEAAVLVRADRGRLERLARFMARHFYRERLVRLFSRSCALARRAGRRPLAQVDAPEFLSLLDGAVLGSEASADAVASRIEEWFLANGPAAPWWPDLVRFEGAFFRAEATPRVWGGEAPSGRAPRRSPTARVLNVGFDLPALLARLDRLTPSDPLPAEVEPKPTRLLLATTPRGVVRVIRMNEGIERLLAAVDGERDAGGIAEACGMTREAAEAALKTLADVGAVELERRA